MTAVAPLYPLLHALPTPTGRHAVAEGVLFLAPATVTTAALVHRGIVAGRGSWPRGWRFDHDAGGAPLIRGGPALPPAIGIAATQDTRALLIGDAPLGIDVETLDRIALNTRADDDWLAPTERALLAMLAPADRTLELACRWVLLEAYGKASGRGLDLPLARFAFTVEEGAATLPAIAADAGWTFSLYRHAALIVGIVAARSGG